MTKKREFGVALKAYRVAANEEIDDVAEAMEIQSDRLHRIELGEELPSLDILEMFINHFSLRDTEAMRLWELAGYSFDEEDNMSDGSNSEETPKEVNVNMPSDMQVLYTDMVHIAGNKYGVVINFIQGVGPNTKPTVVTRVGMSKEHAQSLIEVLQKGIENLEK